MKARMMNHVRIRHVGPSHYVTSGGAISLWTMSVEPHELLRGQARRFWSRFNFPPADHAYVATVDGNLVGFFRYDVARLTRGKIELEAQGTWVAPKYRRAGLASRMWKAALRRHGVTCVEVVTASRAGHGFVRSITDASRGRVKVDEFPNY